MHPTLTTPLKKRLKAAFEERTKKPISEVGMIVTEVKQKPYTKQGIEYTAWIINFHFFDHNLSHITTITKNQYRNTLTQNPNP